MDGRWNPFKDNKSINEIFCHDLLEQDIIDDNGGKELEDLSQMIEYFTTIITKYIEKYKQFQHLSCSCLAVGNAKKV